MRRMPFNIEAMEKLAKEIHYNAETNTIEVGGNLYTDGKWKGHVLTEYDGAKVEVQYLTEDMVIFFVTDTYNERYYGVGYISDDQSSIQGMSFLDSADTLGNFGCVITKGQIQVYFKECMTKEGLPTYYEHQLKVTAENTVVYLSYPSKNNLVIDSLQDLTQVVKPNTNTRLGFGTGYLYYEGNLWKLSTNKAKITAIEDNVVIID